MWNICYISDIVFVLSYQVSGKIHKARFVSVGAYIRYCRLNSVD
jgi:hypothetical protein